MVLQNQFSTKLQLAFDYLEEHYLHMIYINIKRLLSDIVYIKTNYISLFITIQVSLIDTYRCNYSLCY